MKGAVLSAEETKAGVGFDEFFAAEYGRLARAVFLLVRDRYIAEDLAQEAMARVFERWDRVSGMSSPQGYLYRTAVNLHRKRLRRLAVQTRHLISDSRRPQEPDAVVAQRSEVLGALARLPRGQQEVVVLIEALGFEAREVARICGIDPASVRVRLHRAKKALREHLGGPHE